MEEELSEKKKGGRNFKHNREKGERWKGKGGEGIRKREFIGYHIYYFGVIA